MDLSRLRLLLTPAWRPLAALALIGLAIWGFFARPGEREQEAGRELAISAQRRVAVVGGETLLTLSPAEQKAAGIEVAAIHNAARTLSIRAYGMAVDPQAVSDLHNSVVNAQAQLGMAQAKVHQSRLAYTRAERLFAAQAESAANRDTAEAQFRVDQATATAAQTQLETLTANAQQNWGAVLGDSIVKGDEIFSRLATRGDVLIQASLSPGQVLAHAPTRALVQLENGTSLPATYLSDAPKADTHIQGASYFYVVPATAGLLPNMNLAVWLASDTTTAGASVPSSAVVWWQGAAWVYQRLAPTHFVRRRARSDVSAGNGAVVLTGLPDGAEIVVRGSQMLLSEEYRTQAPAGSEERE